ncbi:MAG: L-histidine N(alpha)-methyltransferase, partial [Rhodospirillales bacterium]
MNLLSKTTNTVLDGLAYFVDQIPEQSDFMAEVISGLSQSPKSIPPKFFYDETGSYLFNKICKTPEYYVTRTEIALLNNNGTEISALIGTASNVMEYG